MKIRSLAIAGSIALAGSFAFAGPAAADPPGQVNCWGVVSSQAAQSDGGLGEHSSSFDEPRLGLGNVARAFGLDSVGELGAFLASIDGNEATGC